MASTNNNAIVLRPMQKQDAKPIAAVHHDLDASPWNEPQRLEAYQNSGDGWVLVDQSITIPEYDGLLVGYSIYRSVCEQAELLNFGIRRDYQSRGLGQHLLESTLALLPDSIIEVLLEVRRSNVPANQLYSKLGFNEATVRRDYYPVAGGTREDAIVMIKSLAL